jgi:glycosyltransferase involved in cell wall biosynthesis
VSDLPGVRTTVIEGETGALVPAGDPSALAATVLPLIHSPETCQRMGRAARARAEREYAWDPLIDRLEETYRRATSPA